MPPVGPTSLRDLDAQPAVAGPDVGRRVARLEIEQARELAPPPSRRRRQRRTGASLPARSGDRQGGAQPEGSGSLQRFGVRFIRVIVTRIDRSPVPVSVLASRHGFAGWKHGAEPCGRMHASRVRTWRAAASRDLSASVRERARGSRAQRRCILLAAGILLVGGRRSSSPRRRADLPLPCRPPAPRCRAVPRCRAAQPRWRRCRSETAAMPRRAAVRRRWWRRRRTPTRRRPTGRRPWPGRRTGTTSTSPISCWTPARAPNAANDLGVTPLMLASANGSAPMVERLLAAGADPNAARPAGETALMMAARAGAASVVRLLIAAGADVDQATRGGHTALMWAAAERHPRVVTAARRGRRRRGRAHPRSDPAGAARRAGSDRAEPVRGGQSGRAAARRRPGSAAAGGRVHASAARRAGRRPGGGRRAAGRRGRRGRRRARRRDGN